ncbi:MAG TPA: TonB family protein [Terriglobia bacterium]|nr:TonB family protein [Terriglobia bacterium]
MIAPLWFDNLAAYSVQIALLTIIGTGVATVLRLRAPKVSLAYWQTLLAACLALPLIEPWKQAVVVLTNEVAAVGIEFGAGAIKPAHNGFPIFNVVAVALGLGFALRLFRIVFGLFRLRRYGRLACPWDPVPPAVSEIYSRLGVSSALMLSEEIGGPVTFGSNRPLILFPARVAAMEADCQRAIACHELIHVRHAHWFFNMSEEIILALFWFHPGMAWIVRRIRLAREQSVDREVLHLTEARQPYLRALLDIAGGPAWPLTVPAPEFMNENQLAQRVALILKEASMSKPRLVLSLSIALAFLFLTAQVGVRAFPLKARPLETPAPAERVDPITASGRIVASPEAAEEPAGQKVTPPNSSQDASELTPVHKVQPLYPPLAKVAKIEGTVKLRITVEENGEVSDVRVESGNELLAKAAMEAVRQWKYARQPDEVESTVTVNFTLAKETSDEEKLAAVKAQIERARAEQQGEMAEEQNLAIKRMRDQEEELAAKVKASQDTNQVQAREQQIAMMKAQKAELEARIAKAEEELRAARVHTEGTFTPKPVKTVAPVYPREAKAAHIQGDVVLQVTLDEEGSVSDVEIESGPPALAKSAIDAVRQWQFSKPFQAPVTTTVTINFTLADPETKTPTPPQK